MWGSWGGDAGGRELRPEDKQRQGCVMSDRDAGRPDGLMDARRRMGPGDGVADDDVSGHGMPEIPGAGDGFSAAPQLPRRDGLAGGTEDDVEGHSFSTRAIDQPGDESAGGPAGEAPPA